MNKKEMECFIEDCFSQKHDQSDQPQDRDDSNDVDIYEEILTEMRMLINAIENVANHAYEHEKDEEDGSRFYDMLEVLSIHAVTVYNHFSEIGSHIFNQSKFKKLSSYSTLISDNLK